MFYCQALMKGLIHAELCQLLTVIGIASLQWQFNSNNMAQPVKSG
jgi:hypothetical protein